VKNISAGETVIRKDFSFLAKSSIVAIAEGREKK
jgi:hypothetical protein